MLLIATVLLMNYGFDTVTRLRQIMTGEDIGMIKQVLEVVYSLAGALIVRQRVVCVIRGIKGVWERAK